MRKRTLTIFVLVLAVSMIYLMSVNARTARSENVESSCTVETSASVETTFGVPSRQVSQSIKVKRAKIKWKSARASMYGGAGEFQPTRYGNTRTLAAKKIYGFACLNGIGIRYGQRVIFKRGRYEIIAKRVDYGPAAWTGKKFDLVFNTARVIHLPGVGNVQWAKAPGQMSFNVSGKLSASAVPIKLVVQKYNKKKRKYLAYRSYSVKANDGKFSKKVKVRCGDYRIRSESQAAEGYAAGCSKWTKFSY